MIELIESNPVYTIIWIVIGISFVVTVWDRMRNRKRWGDIPVVTDVIKDPLTNAQERTRWLYFFNVLKTQDFWYIGIRGYGYNENGWEIKRHIVRRLKKDRKSMATRK